MDESPEKARDSAEAVSDAKADAEFERVLRNLVNTPHKPHKPHEIGEREPTVRENGSEVS